MSLMRLRPGIILIVVVLAAIGVTIVYAITHTHPVTAPGAGTPAANAVAPAPGVLPKGLTVKGTDVSKADAQGHPEWTLQAPQEMQVKGSGGQAEAKDVKWKLLQGAKTEWTVDSPQIVVDYQSGKLVFTDGVKAESSDGSRFSVDKLTYEAGSKQLVGEGDARFSSGGALITGQHMVVDTKAHTVRVSGGVHAHVGK